MDQADTASLRRSWVGVGSLAGGGVSDVSGASCHSALEVPTTEPDQRPVRHSRRTVPTERFAKALPTEP
jgi:hypothetical protein